MLFYKTRFFSSKSNILRQDINTFHRRRPLPRRTAPLPARARLVLVRDNKLLRRRDLRLTADSSYLLQGEQSCRCIVIILNEGTNLTVSSYSYTHTGIISL